MRLLISCLVAVCVIAIGGHELHAQAPPGETLLGLSLESGYGTFPGSRDLFLPMPGLELYVHITYWLELRLGLAYHYQLYADHGKDCVSKCSYTSLIGVPTVDLMVKYTLPLSLFWRGYAALGMIGGVAVYRRSAAENGGGASLFGETLLGLRAQLGFGAWGNLDFRWRFGLDYQAYWVHDMAFDAGAWSPGMYGGLFVGVDFKL